MCKDTKKTILVVDDMPANIDLLSSILKKTYNIKAATDGETALIIAGSDNPPDMILLDVSMPGMDGYEALEKLKSSDKTKNIPVIIISGGNEKPENTGMEVHATPEEYMRKPFTPDKVLETVNKFI